jgi:hypothetical protein
MRFDGEGIALSSRGGIVIGSCTLQIIVAMSVFAGCGEWVGRRCQSNDGQPTCRYYNRSAECSDHDPQRVQSGVGFGRPPNRVSAAP